MAKEELELMELLRTRAHQLMLQDTRLQQQNASLRQQLERCEQERAALQKQCRELQAQYADLKIAKTMELSESDARASYRRITNLIRQVDECLSLLKTNE